MIISKKIRVKEGTRERERRSATEQIKLRCRETWEYAWHLLFLLTCLRCSFLTTSYLLLASCMVFMLFPMWAKIWACKCKRRKQDLYCLSQYDFQARKSTLSEEKKWMKNGRQANTTRNIESIVLRCNKVSNSVKYDVRPKNRYIHA